MTVKRSLRVVCSETSEDLGTPGRQTRSSLYLITSQGWFGCTYTRVGPRVGPPFGESLCLSPSYRYGWAGGTLRPTPVACRGDALLVSCYVPPYCFLYRGTERCDLYDVSSLCLREAQSPDYSLPKYPLPPTHPFLCYVTG